MRPVLGCRAHVGGRRDSGSGLVGGGLTRKGRYRGLTWTFGLLAAAATAAAMAAAVAAAGAGAPGVRLRVVGGAPPGAGARRGLGGLEAMVDGFGGEVRVGAFESVAVCVGAELLLVLLTATDGRRAAALAGAQASTAFFCEEGVEKELAGAAGLRNGGRLSLARVLTCIGQR
jgi:hypothetical protein